MHIHNLNYLKGLFSDRQRFKSLIQLCFPPLCAYNSLPDLTKRASNIQMSLTYTLYKNEVPKCVVIEMILTKFVHVKQTPFSPAKGPQRTVSQKSLSHAM